MGDILFVTWDGGGNVPPAMGIASELQRRGDTVRVLGHEQQRNMIEKAGLRFEPNSHQHGFSSTTPEPGSAGYIPIGFHQRSKPRGRPAGIRAAPADRPGRDRLHAPNRLACRRAEPHPAGSVGALLLLHRGLEHGLQRTDCPTPRPRSPSHGVAPTWL